MTTTILVVLGSLILLGVAVVAIAWPLLRAQEEEAKTTAPLEELSEEAPIIDPLTELLERRDSIYEAIRELRFDYQVGKVSQADYQLFESQLKAQAVQILKEIDALQAAEADPDLDARLEAEIAALRRNGHGLAQAPSEEQQVSVAARYCPQCGARIRQEDRFCGQCGIALESG